MRISDWSSDVCSSDLALAQGGLTARPIVDLHCLRSSRGDDPPRLSRRRRNTLLRLRKWLHCHQSAIDRNAPWKSEHAHGTRSEEHTSELQSLMRISYAVFCLKKKKKTNRMNTRDRKNESY